MFLLNPSVHFFGGYFGLLLKIRSHGKEFVRGFWDREVFIEAKDLQ